MFEYNSTPMSRGRYNLIVSKRDVGLWQIGMKPNRHWKISDVKWYFGIKGNKAHVLEQLEDYLINLQ